VIKVTKSVSISRSTANGDQPLGCWKKVFPGKARHFEPPHVRPPGGQLAAVLIFTLFIHGSEVKVAVRRLDDLGVNLLLALTLTPQTGSFERGYRIAPVDQLVRFRDKLEQVR